MRHKQVVRVPVILAPNITDNIIDVFPENTELRLTDSGKYYDRVGIDHADYDYYESYLDGQMFPQIMRYVGKKPLATVEIVITFDERPSGWYWVKFGTMPHQPCEYFPQQGWKTSGGFVTDEHWSDILPDILFPSKGQNNG